MNGVVVQDAMSNVTVDESTGRRNKNKNKKLRTAIQKNND